MFDLNINNLSSYTHNVTEEFVLKHEPEFCIPPSRIKRKLVFSEFKLLFTYLAKHTPTSTVALLTLKILSSWSSPPVFTIDKSDYYLHRQH